MFVQTLLLKIEICIIMISSLLSAAGYQYRYLYPFTLNLLANLRIFIQYSNESLDSFLKTSIGYRQIPNLLRYMLYLKKRTFSPLLTVWLLYVNLLSFALRVSFTFYFPVKLSFVSASNCSKLFSLTTYRFRHFRSPVSGVQR